VLDFDALSAEEGVPWAWGGAECLPPEQRLCMVRLSRGGSDAVEIREFDAEALAGAQTGSEPAPSTCIACGRPAVAEPWFAKAY